MSTYRTELHRSRDPRFVQSRISEEGVGILGTTTDGPVIAVVGSRDFYDYPLLKETLDTLLTRSATLISGGASGADALAEKYAREHGRTIEVIAPDFACSLAGTELLPMIVLPLKWLSHGLTQRYEWPTALRTLAGAERRPSHDVQFAAMYRA